MYLNIHGKVVIGPYTFHTLNSCEIRLSLRTLTDTASVTVPRRFMANGQLITNLESILPAEEDVPIEIWLGYNGDLHQEFKGWVDYYEPRESLTIYCQDEMYQLKRGTVKRQWQSANLKQVLEVLAAGYEVTATDMSLGSLIFKNVNPALALQSLQDDYGVYSYFRPTTTELVSGFIYDETYSTHLIHLQKNVKRKEGLVYEKRDVSQYQVKAISNQRDGSKIEVFIPEKAAPGASVRTLNFGPYTKEELKRLAQAELKRSTYSGFRGDLTLFGIPRISPGDVIQIQDAVYGRSGSNYVDEVIKVVRPVMYEQHLKLGPQI